jgi:hypothetical protein
MRLLRFAAALACLGWLFVAPAQAADTGPLNDACAKQALVFVGEARAGSVPALCACVVGAFQDAPQADLDLLTKGMLGTASDADRPAHANYDDLIVASRDTISSCVASTGLDDLIPFTADTDPGVIEGDIPFVTPDMTAFEATCRKSESLLNWMSDGSQTGEQIRDKICTCLVAEFPLNFPQSIVDLFEKTLAGTLSDAERAAESNFETFADRAEAIMGQCVTSAGLR